MRRCSQGDWGKRPKTGRKSTFPASWRVLHASIGPVLEAMAMLARADLDGMRGDLV